MRGTNYEKNNEKRCGHLGTCFVHLKRRADGFSRG